MPLRRVVITGAGAVSPFGASAEKMMAALTRGESGIGRLPQHDYSDTQDVPQVAGRVPRLDTTSIPRRHRRTMSPISCWSLLAAEEALAQALDITGRAMAVTSACASSAQSIGMACEAIAGLCGRLVPVSRLKGHLGYIMAASGALELIACIGMLQQGILIPTLNLDNPDEQCDIIRHVNKLTSTPVQLVPKNSFALGGIISTLILRKI